MSNLRPLLASQHGDLGVFHGLYHLGKWTCISCDMYIETKFMVYGHMGYRTQTWNPRAMGLGPTHQ